MTAATRSRKKLDLTEAEKLKLEASVEKAKEDILNKRGSDDDRDKWYQENKARYRCKITPTGSRKGEKTLEMFYENPDNPGKPVKLNCKLGVWLEEGLPMYVIQRIQEAYDSNSEEIPANPDPLVTAGKYHTMGRTPRFVVQFDNKPVGAA